METGGAQAQSGHSAGNAFIGGAIAFYTRVDTVTLGVTTTALAILFNPLVVFHRRRGRHHHLPHPPSPPRITIGAVAYGTFFAGVYTFIGWGAHELSESHRAVARAHRGRSCSIDTGTAARGRTRAVSFCGRPGSRPCGYGCR